MVILIQRHQHHQVPSRALRALSPTDEIHDASRSTSRIAVARAMHATRSAERVRPFR
jgi:hypothetical protein